MTAATKKSANGAVLPGDDFDAFLDFLGVSNRTRDDAPDSRDDASSPAAPVSLRAGGDSVVSSSSSSAIPATVGASTSVNIEDRYLVAGGKLLGAGLGGSVSECVDRPTGVRYAVKTVPKGDQDQTESLSREVALLRDMNYRGIIRLVDVFEDDECVHLVTDLCAGGSLFDRIIKKKVGGDGGGRRRCFAEGDASRIVREILGAVSYMHRRGVAHRDIKPENLLFETTEEDSPVKVIDFGLAREHVGGQDEPMRDSVGSPYYIAPEVLRGEYDRSCDLWSVGVVAYVLLCGYPPFNGADRAGIYRSVLDGRYRFPSRDWDGTSREAIDFVRRLLEVDASRRMTAEQALVHPWIMRSSNDSTDGVRARKEVGQQKVRPLLDEVIINGWAPALFHWAHRKVHVQ